MIAKARWSKREADREIEHAGLSGRRSTSVPSRDRGSEDGAHDERPYGKGHRDDPVAKLRAAFRFPRYFQRQVTSVRAVVGPPEQRCWVEPAPGLSRTSRQPQRARSDRRRAPIGGALGHQVGGGQPAET